MICQRSSLAVGWATATTLLFSFVLPAANGQTLLAHFETECLSRAGCSHSINEATQVEYSLEVYPGTTSIVTLNNMETTDTTIEAPGYLHDYLTSGELSAPEPLFFISTMVGAGGSGRQASKQDLLDGFMFANDVFRYEMGYDVPLNNGIDLDGTAEVTQLRLQVFEAKILPSSQLDGSALKTHYRVEILGTLVPEPSTATPALALMACLAWYRYRSVE